jgi:hypothetical protein
VATSRPECTADLQPQAQKVLGELGAAAKAYAAGEPLPAVEGLNITPHGDRAGTWYFSLGPKIPDSVFAARRAQNAAVNQGGGFGPGGPGGQGGPGGEGGGPGGFQPRVNVPRNTSSPRPDFTPPPELIAALAPLRAAASCAYGTTLTPAEAKAKGFDVQVGAQAAGARPSPSPAASAAPGASPAPRASPGPRRGGGSPLNYAPGIGIFVVRAPDLGTGGGSVKQ